jgi:hypothetical protein
MEIAEGVHPGSGLRHHWTNNQVAVGHHMHISLNRLTLRNTSTCKKLRSAHAQYALRVLSWYRAASDQGQQSDD